MNEKRVPVITIDGPSGSGKGTICQLLAAKLGFHYLDSGALYRLLALAAKRHGVSLDNMESLAVLAAHMDISFKTRDNGNTPKVMLEGEDVSALIRSEGVGTNASVVAAYPEVRDAASASLCRVAGPGGGRPRYGYRGFPRRHRQSLPDSELGRTGAKTL